MITSETNLPNPIPSDAYRRYDESSDQQFYQSPRFVTHIDDPAIAAVTQLYRECFTAGSALLDLMSSWISHLPDDISYNRVVGLGMNDEELAANKRLDHRVVHDLNHNPILPFAENEFDGAAICVSVDYLSKPVAVMRELGRVLKPGTPLVMTFSNRCFPAKVVAIWQMLDDIGHMALVSQYLKEAANWDNIETLDRSPDPGRSDPLYAVIGRSAGNNKDAQTRNH
ncbi:MAG: methyltransferase domain-containing protein [Gemmatimonadota bacterium]|nr:methyltransferase domain-containing protein [Gemmatimonadota bacterium]